MNKETPPQKPLTVQEAKDEAAKSLGYLSWNNLIDTIGYGFRTESIQDKAMILYHTSQKVADIQTLESCQDEVAVKLGYKNWDDYVENGIESSADSEMYKLLSAENAALTLYASQLPRLVSAEKETDAVEFRTWMDKNGYMSLKSITGFRYFIDGAFLGEDFSIEEVYAKFTSTKKQ